MKLDIQSPILIVGLGVSGLAAQRLLNLQGYKEVYTFDDKSSLAQFNNPTKAIQEVKPKTLVVSPGVPLKTPWIQDLQKAGVVITSELALAYEFLTTEKIVAVTGSIGKSTTTALLEAGMKAFSPDCFAGGNLGIPLATYIADILENKRKRAPWIAIELSSYQLENYGNFKADVSVITYLTPNHLIRYSSLEDYYSYKIKLIHLTRQTVVLNENGGDLKKVLAFYDSPLPLHWVKESSLASKLIGQHNKDNMAMAVKISELCGWPTECLKGFSNFPGLPHRLENAGVWQGIQFINDSKATAMDSVITAATGALQDTKNILFLLLGGRDKDLPWEQLQILKNYKNINFIFFGECAEIAQHKSQLSGFILKTLEEAVASVAPKAKPGDTVLLSPGGTSWDEFKSFEDRGDHFKKYIQKYFKT